MLSINFFSPYDCYFTFVTDTVVDYVIVTYFGESRSAMH